MAFYAARRLLSPAPPPPHARERIRMCIKLTHKYAIGANANNQGSYTGHTTALYLLFLDFAGTGGPLRFLEDDASFAARCACLNLSMLALLWALWSTMGRG